MKTDRITTEQKALLELVRLGCCETQELSDILMNADWNKLFELACKQGVVAVAWRGMEKLYECNVNCCPVKTKLLWFARSQQAEKAAKRHQEKATAFAQAVKPLKLAVLKGIDYAQYWPNPLWREFGDLDCMLIGADSHELDMKCRALGFDVDDHDYKHTEIHGKGIMVENHHFFTGFGGSKDARKQEEVLQQLFNGEGCKIGNSCLFDEIGESGLLSPNVNFTAYFLLAHAQNHFFYEGMNLRQILDWHFFLMKEGGNVDWPTVKDAIERTRLMPFAVLLTNICEKFFSLPDSIFSTGSTCKDELIDDFLCDIFSEQYNQKRELIPMIGRLTHRLGRTIKFRELNKMSVATSVWRWFAFTSYLNRRPTLPNNRMH